MNMVPSSKSYQKLIRGCSTPYEFLVLYNKQGVHGDEASQSVSRHGLQDALFSKTACYLICQKCTSFECQSVLSMELLKI